MGRWKDGFWYGNLCSECGEEAPTGYSKCRSCTFGPNSLEGRVERAYRPGGGGLEEEERVVRELRTLPHEVGSGLSGQEAVEALRAGHTLRDYEGWTFKTIDGHVHCRERDEEPWKPFGFTQIHAEGWFSENRGKGLAIVEAAA